MAERRPPGFNVPLGFYDGPEVKSIPRRIRAAAVGVWTLCGAFSANKLQDGYVGPETLRELGCTDAIRSALMSTRGPDGQPDPLWVPARDGGIQFTKWVKYQRSRAEVKAYRDADAARKRAEREAKKAAETSGDGKMSERTGAGHPPDYCEPKAKAKTESSFSYVPESATDSTGRDSIAATPAAALVRRTIPREINDSIQTGLRIAAGTLLKSGTAEDVVEEALIEWATKTGVGPGVLASMAADVVKRRNGHSRNKPKVRSLAQLAHQERAREQAPLHAVPTPKELS